MPTSTWSPAAPRRSRTREEVEDVALEREVAGHVGPAEAELAGCVEHPAQGVRRLDHDRGRARSRTDDRPVPRPHPDRQVGAEQPSEQRVQGAGHVARGGGRSAAGARRAGVWGGSVVVKAGDLA